MKIPTKMTSVTGTKRSPKSGLTFIEVMVTLAILSLGLVVVLKGYLRTLDQISYLTHRLYVSNFLDDRLAQIRKIYRLTQTISLDQNNENKGNTKVEGLDLTVKTKIAPVPNIQDTLEVQLDSAWQEHGNTVHLSRSTFIYNPQFGKSQ